MFRVFRTPGSVGGRRATSNDVACLPDIVLGCKFVTHAERSGGRQVFDPVHAVMAILLDQPCEWSIVFRSC